MESFSTACARREPWNKGKLVGQKAPLKLKEIWAIRVRLQLAERRRELALFNLAIDSKLRACDLVKLRVRDVCHGRVVAARAIVLQPKNSAASSVRNHRTHARSRGGLDRLCRSYLGAGFISKPASWFVPPVHPAVRPDRRRMGQADRPEQGADRGLMVRRPVLTGALAGQYRKFNS
jgi:hypothetical protein